MSSKDESGAFFSKSDEEHVKAQKQPSRRQQQSLRSQFLEKARKFMDNSPLGESKGFLAAWKGEADDNEPEESEAATAEEDWEEDWEEEEEFDYSDPETIRVGYAKPGSKPPPRRKTLEEARDESFDLKLGALSGLLGRFGAERTEEERPEAKVAVQIDMPLFKAQMREIYLRMAQESGESPDTDWLRPELLSLLRLSNPPALIVDFLIAAIFAATPENFLTHSDRAYLFRLLHQIGIDVPLKELEETVEQTFLFVERVHRLYSRLLENPPRLSPEQVARQKENLAKLFIHQVAHFYGTDHKSVIRTLAERWTHLCQQLSQEMLEIERIAQQLALFKERKMASATIFTKAIRAEQQALAHWRELQAMSRDILSLRKVTQLLEEHEALQKLQAFPVEQVLEEEALVWVGSPSWQEIQQIFIAFQQRKQVLCSVPREVAVSASPLDLSPLNQKKIVSRAKNGEIKALKEIEAYKSVRIAQILNDIRPAVSANPAP